MQLFDFFRTESSIPQTPIILMAVVSGLANSFILASVNAGAQAVATDVELEITIFIVYIISLLLFIYSRKTSLYQATVAVEDAVSRVRVRIADKLRQSELRHIENTGKTDIYTYLTQDTALISQSAIMVIAAAQSAIVLLFCLIYIGIMSPIGFFLTAITFTSGILIYLGHNKTLNEELKRTTHKETEFFQTLDHILSGFKEIKINRRKNDALFQRLKKISEESEQLKVKVGLDFIIDLMFSRVTSNLLLGVMVFILPMFDAVSIPVVIKIAATILFVMGPIENITSALPVLVRANVAVNNLRELEYALDEVHRHTLVIDVDVEDEEKNEIEDNNFENFKTITLDNIHFQYTDREGVPQFQVQNLNLTIQRGEILFIVGGNGSGKSTTLKLLVGLYYPLSGAILVDDEEIDQYTYPAYRDLFSIIFTDFHLFDRLYGLPKIDKKRLRNLLKTLDLDKKTQYIRGAFTNTDLSTGQKKRLAFASAMLEDKPVYILDELAADQDPPFRQYFYEELLPELKAQGKTIIAVSHDDRYFHCADRVLTLEYGKIIRTEMMPAKE